MFVHMSPEPDAVGETISTLKFAERVATVELGAARVNKDDADVKELKEQVIIFLYLLYPSYHCCLYHTSNLIYIVRQFLFHFLSRLQALRQH